MNESNIEITVKVNGEAVPLSTISEETFKKMRKAEIDEEENAPVFSIVDHGYCYGRLVVKMNSKVREYFKKFAKQVPLGHYCSFEPNGNFGSYDMGETWEEAKSFYSREPRPLFERG